MEALLLKHFVDPKYTQEQLICSEKLSPHRAVEDMKSFSSQSAERRQSSNKQNPEKLFVLVWRVLWPAGKKHHRHVPLRKQQQLFVCAHADSAAVAQQCLTLAMAGRGN